MPDTRSRRRPTQAKVPDPVSFGSVRPDNTTFALVSFEGPDRYSNAGGLGTRMQELARALAGLGFETHLYFVGDPDLPAVETDLEGRLTLHRWCQWISREHPSGVYDGETGKIRDFTRSLPSALAEELVGPAREQGRRVAVLAEDWHTAWATMDLSDLLHARGLRGDATLLWNANNVFGCERIPFPRLAYTSTITAVSRFMKQRLWAYGVNPIVIPNGIPERLLEPIMGDPQVVRSRFLCESLLIKVARFDPDKRWLQAIHTVAQVKSAGVRPLLIARGGLEPHGRHVLQTAAELGLQVTDALAPEGSLDAEGVAGYLAEVAAANGADVLNVRFRIPEATLRLLYAGADGVLANSGFEPFGLVGLEAMADRSLVFTGATGEEYARSYENAICVETDDAKEIAAALAQLRASPELEARLRAAGRATAEQYTWPRVIQGLCRRIENLVLWKW